MTSSQASEPQNSTASPASEVDTAAIVERVLTVFDETVKASVPGATVAPTADTPLFELGIDSLKQLEIVGKLQEEFSIRIPEMRLYDIETCGQVAEAIEEQLLAGKQNGSEGSSKATADSFASFPEVMQLRARIDMLEAAGCKNPFFSVYESIGKSTTVLGGNELVDFARFNYLGMAGDPAVNAAAKEAIDRYGTSAASSRLVSGTTTLHDDLETALANHLGTDKSLCFTSGFVTNTALIGHLMGPGDVIVHDELIHNSIVTGSQLSGAERLSFTHNDWQALDELLTKIRGNYRRALVIVEGVYSMDGDYPQLPEFVDVKSRHDAMLMVDEAHSIGVMGPTGGGICQHFGVDAKNVEILVGTIGKALGGAGGFVAGSEALIDYIKYTCPGIIFSTALTPPGAAASLKALQILQHDTERLEKMRARSSQFLKLAKERGINTGTSEGTPIVPVILGSSIISLKASQELLARGFNVPPILAPAVDEEAARLRYFIAATHTSEQIERAATALAEVLEELGVIE